MSIKSRETLEGPWGYCGRNWQAVEQGLTREQSSPVQPNSPSSMNMQSLPCLVITLIRLVFNLRGIQLFLSPANRRARFLLIYLQAPPREVRSVTLLVP